MGYTPKMSREERRARRTIALGVVEVHPMKMLTGECIHQEIKVLPGGRVLCLECFGMWLPESTVLTGGVAKPVHKVATTLVERAAVANYIRGMADHVEAGNVKAFELKWKDGENGMDVCFTAKHPIKALSIIVNLADGIEAKEAL